MTTLAFVVVLLAVFIALGRDGTSASLRAATARSLLVDAGRGGRRLVLLHERRSSRSAARRA